MSHTTWQSKQGWLKAIMENRSKVDVVDDKPKAEKHLSTNEVLNSIFRLKKAISMYEKQESSTRTIENQKEDFVIPNVFRLRKRNKLEADLLTTHILGRALHLLNKTSKDENLGLSKRSEEDQKDEKINGDNIRAKKINDEETDLLTNNVFNSIFRLKKSVSNITAKDEKS